MTGIVIGYFFFAHLASTGYVDACHPYIIGRLHYADRPETCY